MNGLPAQFWKHEKDINLPAMILHLGHGKICQHTCDLVHYAFSATAHGKSGSPQAGSEKS